MRVLYLLDDYASNGQDMMITEGLYILLGPEGFVDYPKYCPIWHDDASVSDTTLYNGALWKKEEPDRTDIEEKLRNHHFDLVLVSNRAGSSGRIDVPGILSLAKSLNIRTAEIEGEDRYPYAHHLSKGADFLFSRERVRGFTHYLPFSACENTFMPLLPISERTMDVFGILHNSNPTREYLIGGNPWQDTLQMVHWRASRIYHREHKVMVQHAKVGVSAAGGGWDTFRYWEIPAAGAFLISSPCPHQIPNPFPHIFYVSTPDGLVSACRNVLAWSDDELFSKLQENQNHAQQFHSTTARAKYILEEMSK